MNPIQGNGRLRLEVALIYEDLATGLRAKRVCDRLRFLLGHQPEVHLNLWRFDLFRVAAWQEPALKAAARADMVVVSAHGRGVWPEAVSSWLVRWLELGSDAPPALVVSLDTDAKGSDTANQLLAGLRLAAGPAGVVLFEHFGDVITVAKPFTEGRRHPTLTSPVLPLGLLHPADSCQPRHWGINE